MLFLLEIWLFFALKYIMVGRFYSISTNSVIWRKKIILMNWIFISSRQITMANWLSSPESVIISIPEAVNEDHVTFYEIDVKINDVEWKVRRRFREFVDLHESLTENGVDKESLPQKKLLGTKDPSFIMKRHSGLFCLFPSHCPFLPLIWLFWQEIWLFWQEIWLFWHEIWFLFFIETWLFLLEIWLFC